MIKPDAYNAGNTGAILKMIEEAGFKLKAMIVTFPGGIPGDVGFFLSWAPEAK